MRKIELLAPARDKACAFAAIEHGADAVYIGAERFGARAAAGNTLEDIAEVVGYAHQFGVKVYATLNTLLHDEERPIALQMARDLVSLGVDAIITQDPFFVQYTGELPLHASTQMDNRDANIVRQRQQEGFLQTVLARELTIEEIASIHREVPQMPLEVFIHGAICVCYNGRCYASEVCYGRSANRGECAQFCRMPYDLEDGQGNKIAEGQYLLSMRDMNRTAELEALLDSGVTSLKIEGRLKDVAYVKNITAWYRQQLDKIFLRRKEYCRSSRGREEFFFTPDPDRTFNRGYTDYFMHGRSGDLCSMISPKSIGQKVGFVKEIRRNHIVVAGTAVFHNGDGLCFEHNGKLQGFRINRAEGNHLYPHQMPEGLHDGMVLYRNQDEAMEKILQGRTSVRRIPLKWILSEEEGGFRLIPIIDGERQQGCFFSHDKEEARTDQSESIRQVLSKMGDTIYNVESVEIQFTGNWFIPRSLLAEWRRKTL